LALRLLNEMPLRGTRFAIGRQFCTRFALWKTGEHWMYVSPMADEKEYASIVTAEGAEFRGVQSGPQETLILFADPQLGHILAVTESEFCPEAVSNRLAESRRALDLEMRVQKSLC
jgi:hypothetical protein